ncbi:ArdC family protein [Bradyrhizobium prioriisuperbiae]|uniref:ArdC family protein n=1 Tax=Bradyrhizobium prioriisuperbiae TaxID=2854389 RepID=UPI0028E590C0|nr:zincin-like metallopeptidase domain-containing protein [Bradyrhizobium prioritasuperba]
MPHTEPESAEKPRVSLYQEITDRIVGDLRQGIVPWVRPWGALEGAALGLPRNAVTGRTYAGINILILWGRLFDAAYLSQCWLTFRQAKALGGTVTKGECGVGVFYADRYVPKEPRRGGGKGEGDAQERQPVPFLRRYTVFNVAQCEGLPATCGVPAPSLPDREIVPEAEALARATLADIRHGGDAAFYAPDADAICLPHQPAFFDQINYYRTLFHELGHWTGHPRRLNRDQSGAFGSTPYAFEELVAEMTAAFVCASLGIVPTVRHADYLGMWLGVLRGDSRAIFRAASKASKAADVLLAFRPQPDQSPTPTAAVSSEGDPA